MKVIVNLQLSRYSVYATVWTTEESWFESQQVYETFPARSRPNSVSAPSLPNIRPVRENFSLRIKHLMFGHTPPHTAAHRRTPSGYD
jgi:hypothetical protein